MGFAYRVVSHRPQPERLPCNAQREALRQAEDVGESREWDVVHEQLVAVVGDEAEIVDDSPRASRHSVVATDSVIRRARNSEKARTLFPLCPNADLCWPSAAMRERVQR